MRRGLLLPPLRSSLLGSLLPGHLRYSFSDCDQIGRTFGPRSNRLDRIPRELDPLLPAEQLQQYEHPLVRT